MGSRKVNSVSVSVFLVHMDIPEFHRVSRY